MRVVTLGRLSAVEDRSASADKLARELELFDAYFYGANRTPTPRQEDAYRQALDALEVWDTEQTENAHHAVARATSAMKRANAFCIPRVLGGRGCPREGVSLALFGVGAGLVGLVSWGVYSWWRNR